MLPEKQINNPWSTPLQALLLHACLDERKKALLAWNKWKKEIDIDQLDQGSFRLLSLLYQRLQVHNIEDPLMHRLKGVFRMDWYRNKMIFNAGIDALKALQTKKIPTMLLKGAALNHIYYKDFGIRPMNDFDILVPRHRAKEAIKTLIEKGFKSKITSFNVSLFTEDNILKHGHAHTFVNAKGYEVDLHWHAIHHCYYPHVDDGLWKRAIPVTFEKTETNTLHPIDMLLHVCIHGSQWNALPTIRWIIDASMIIKKISNNANWQILTQEAQSRHLILPTRFMLEHIKADYNTPIPKKVLQQLSSFPVNNFEYWHYYFSTKTLGPGQVLSRILLLLTLYYRHQVLNKSKWIETINPLNVISYLKNIFAFASTLNVLRWGLSRTFVRLKEGISSCICLGDEKSV